MEKGVPSGIPPLLSIGSTLHILHVYRTYFPDPPGGLQEAIRQIALATSARGMTNTIFTLTPKPHERAVVRPEATVIRCRSWGAPASCDLGGPDAFYEFTRLAKTVDIIQYHFPWPFADLLHLLIHPSVPTLLTWHSDIVRQRWLGKLYEPLMRYTLASTRAIVTTSPAYAERSSVLSRPSIRNKVRVIPLGIDKTSYPIKTSCSVDGEAIFGKLGFGKNEPFFLFIGVLRYYKGVEFLVKAAQKLNVKVVIAGEGPERIRLKELAGECAKIIFAGQVGNREKVALLKHCRALVLPSHLRSEAFGMVLAEAAMFGKPMISCDIGTGTSYVNADGETGIVVPAACPLALAEAMRALLEDEAMAARMGQAALARYERLFSGATLGQAYARLYDEIA
jgi:rhamnosyl/mannosyltransferase